MRTVLLLISLLVVVAALLVAFDVISLDGGWLGRDEGDMADEPTLHFESGEEEAETRLEGRPGAASRRARDRAAGGADAEAEEVVPSRVGGTTPNGARLTGRVVEGEGRIPVPGARVRLGVSNALYAYLRAERRGRFDELEARTDEDGHFAFYDITPARGYAVRVRAADRPAVSALKIDLRGRPSRDLGDLVLGEPATLDGRVVDERGEGIPDARVAVTWLVENPMRIVLADPDTLPETERMVRTDEHGAFRVEALEPGVKTIVIDAGSQGQTAIRSFTVEAKTTTTLPDVVFDGEGVLAGRVEWEGGVPIAAARVFAGPLDSSSVRTVETDADGSWRLERLADAKYSVGVLVPGLPLKLEQGVELGREDIVTTLPVTGSIRGRVTAETTGNPVPDFRVQLVRTAPTGDPMAQYMQRVIDEVIGPLPVRDEEGRFELTPIPPGAYRVRVEAEGYPTATSDAIEVRSGTQQAELHIRLPKGHGLLGVVLGDDAQAVAGVRVYVAPAAVVESVRAELNPSMLEDWADDERVAAVSNADGEFALPPQTPGVYYLLLVHDEYQPTLVADVDLQREATSAVPMQIKSAGRVKGRLVGGGGSDVEGEPVLLAFASGAIYELEVDAEGRFERGALPLGECLALWYASPRHPLVRALRQASDDAARTKAYEALREAGATPLRIASGRATTVTLQTGPRVRIEGTLRVDGVAPTDQALVWIVYQGGGRGISAQVEGTGRFEALLAPGNYAFWARGADGAWSVTNIAVEGGSGQRVELER